MSWTRTSGSRASQSSRAQAARLAVLSNHALDFCLCEAKHISHAVLQRRLYDIKVMHEKGDCWLQVPQDVLQKLLETLQENHYQEDEQFLGAVMPRLGNYDL